MKKIRTLSAAAFFLLLFLPGSFFWTPFAQAGNISSPQAFKISDHFDGNVFFNPDEMHPMSAGPAPQSHHGIFSFAWRWLFSDDQPLWPQLPDIPPAVITSPRVAAGGIRITTVGHSTFLIQLDGLNLLTDPIWSQRCSPVSWAGPRRHKPPGLRLDDLPPIDAILISHNHYDHLDLPTLKQLVVRNTKLAIAPLGNAELVKSSGLPLLKELDWWQSVSLAPNVKVTLVPARHFAMRTLWDRNKTLWGGFVISGPAGNVYYAGDTGYGSHFAEIARRYAPLRVALLPIAPFRPQTAQGSSIPNYSGNHMSPADAVKAHFDLKADLSIAAHFQVFQLGWDGFDDAVNGLTAALQENKLAPDVFIAPAPGQTIEINRAGNGAPAREN